jgi:hypothetical protein
MMKAVRTSETSVYFNEITLRFIPEDSNLKNILSQTHVLANFKMCFNAADTFQTRCVLCHLHMSLGLVFI